MTKEKLANPNMRLVILCSCAVVAALLLSSTALGEEAAEPKEASPPTQQAEPDGVKPLSAQQRARRVKVEQAVKQLLAEAQELEQFKDTEHVAVFRRPHPVLQLWGAEMGPATLDRMLKKFTGNTYRDTYVRWHLIWVVQQMLDSEFDKFKRTGEHTIPEGAGGQLVRLIKKMPPPISGKKRPYLRYDPPEIASQYHALWAKTRVQVGYPPFQRDYYGEAALPYFPPARQEEIKLIIAQTKELAKKFKAIVDHDAVAYNSRITQVNLLVRQYRGELIYCIMQTGDPDMLKLVTTEIDRQVTKNQRVGLDLMAYMYLAAYDGYLALYDTKLLSDVGRALGRTSKAANKYTEYFQGKDSLPPWVEPRNRNFAEYAFHLTELLKQPETISQFLSNDLAAAPSSSGGGGMTKSKFTPENLTIEQVRQAIRLASRELLQPGAANRSLMPHYAIRSDHDLWTFYTHGIYSPARQEIVHEIGNHAVICWALLSSGESYQDPRLFKRINWVLNSDTPYIYDRGMRLLMLGRLAYDRWAPAVKRDARFLGRALSEHGNWGYQFYGEENSSWGDHANGQYGVLGLWAAQKSGVGIKDAVWARIDRHWRQTQQQTEAGQPAGWALGMLGADNSKQSAAASTLPFYSDISGPMTAGGVATLTMTERNLYGPKFSVPGKTKMLPHLGKGIAWLDKNFTMDASGEQTDWFYYMWTIQRVGQATGYRTFNGIDWFRQVTAEVLNRQSPDGLWRDPTGKQGALLSTGFAMLYLGAALDPIAVSKIRFDGRWNNRPNDMWNFVDYASSMYEQDTAWQIVDLDMPVYQLMDSPILYLATDKKFELPPEHVQRLRDYIDAGGLLVTNPESKQQQVAKSIRKLAEQLFPGKKLQKVEADHLLYNVHEKLRPVVRLGAIDNGIRPLMVNFGRDIGEGLQTNDTGKSESFVALSNLYLYTVGMNPRRVRLKNNYVMPAQTAQPPRSLLVARVRYEGTYDPEPAALVQLQTILANAGDVKLTVQTVRAGELGEHKLAFLTTIGDGELTDAEAAALRKWIDAGGMLCLDAAGGSKRAVDAVSAMLSKIAPQGIARPLSSRHPIITGKRLAGMGHDNRRVKYRYYALRAMGPTITPRLQVVMINQRPAIIFSPEDLTAGLAGLEHWGIFGYSVESARKLVTNIVMAALDAAQ